MDVLAAHSSDDNASGHQVPPLNVERLQYATVSYSWMQPAAPHSSYVLLCSACCCKGPGCYKQRRGSAVRKG